MNQYFTYVRTTMDLIDTFDPALYIGFFSISDVVRGTSGLEI